MLKSFTKTVLAITLCSGTSMAFAQNDIWEERQRLQHLKTEVEALKVLVNHAKIVQVKDQRTHFQYHVLTKDLDTIIKSIEHHLSKPFEVQKPQMKTQPLAQNYTTYKTDN